MNIEFKLPELGENVENGDVVKILVREGQVIAANDGVCELETDKAVVEIPCPHAGKITTIHVKKGETVLVGQTLLTIEAEEQAAGGGQPAAETPARAAADVDKHAAGLPAGGALSESSAALADKPPVAPEAGAAASVQGPIPAGPAARRLARELGVDLGRISGTGQRGRITPEDVKAAGQATPPAASGLPEQVVPPGEPGEDAWGPIRRERMSKVRRTIAAQVVKSASTIPHVTNFDDADVTDLEAIRKSVPPGYFGEDVKLTAMPFLLRAVALALGQHPTLNASLDDETEEVVYKQYVNLGVAVDTPRGLVVPVLRGVDRMSIPQIARQLRSLAQRARAAEFAIEELRGGTFTISNLGAVGGTYSTPIINHPEVAILLVGRSRWMPAVRDAKIEPRLFMPVSLSYDHRLVDGATAGRFLNQVIDYLQLPGKLLLTAAADPQLQMDIVPKS
ncbi:MAG: dihydrolipoamide acetyltransferase family protein [Planctomycetota bacterium]